MFFQHLETWFQSVWGWDFVKKSVTSHELAQNKPSVKLKNKILEVAFYSESELKIPSVKNLPKTI